MAKMRKEAKAEEVKKEEVIIEPIDAKPADEVVLRNPDIIASNPAPKKAEQPKSIRNIEVLSTDETQMIIEARLRKILQLENRAPAKGIIPALVKYKQAEGRPPIEALVEIDYVIFRDGYDYYIKNAPNATPDGYMKIIQKLMQGSIKHYRTVASINLV